MFTGIIEKKAKILDINKWRLKIENIFNKSELNIWQSIAHDGACMTLESFDDESWSIFVMEESFKKTNFHWKKIWDYFNIERCMKLWDRLDWHMVSWHIDWTWKVLETKILDDDSKIIKVWFDEKFKNLIIEKWSITINGTSLTIVDEDKDFLIVSIIPLTQEITNLWDLKTWDIVNLEFDMVWKYINKINK